MRLDVSGEEHKFRGHKDLDLSLRTVTNRLCDLGQVTQSLKSQ